MTSPKGFLIVVAVAAVTGLIGMNLWSSFEKYQQNLSAASQPNVTQEQMDAAASELARQEAERLEEIRNSLPPIQSMASTAPESSAADADQAPADGSSSGTQTDKPESGSDVEIDRPEFEKPEPPPPPSIPEDQKQNPNSKPDAPKQPENTTPKDGQRRTNENGQLEIYMEGFGWITDSGLPNVNIPSHEAGTGDVIGY